MVAQQTQQTTISLPAGINHPGMSAKWFDAAVQRSYEKDLRVMESGKPGLYFMASSSRTALVYRVTDKACACEAHRKSGRCYHRARAIFENWMHQMPEPEPEPPAPATPAVVMDDHVVKPIRYTTKYHTNDGYDHQFCGYCEGDGWCCDRPDNARPLPRKRA